MKMPGASKLHHIEIAPGSLWAPLSGPGKFCSLVSVILYRITQLSIQRFGGHARQVVEPMHAQFSPHQRPPGGSDRDVLGCYAGPPLRLVPPVGGSRLPATNGVASEDFGGKAQVKMKGREKLHGISHWTRHELLPQERVRSALVIPS